MNICRDSKPHNFPAADSELSAENTNLHISRPISILTLKKQLLLSSTLLQIQPYRQNSKTGHAQPKEKVERHRGVSRRRCIDNRTRDKRSNERRGLANDTEQTKEKEVVAPGCDFGDHDLRVTIPRADEKAVIYLVELFFTPVSA